MKSKILLLFISAVLSISILNSISALANPATVYCEELNKEFGGYDYQIKADENGNQYGVCIAEGNEYEEWAFLEGKVGEDDSYCAKKGYGIKIVNKNENEYAVCIVPKSETMKSEEYNSAFSSENSKEQEISMEELMNLGEKVAARGVLQHKQSISQDSEEGRKLMSSFQQQGGSVGSTYNQINYSYWDWRNPPNTTVYSSDKFSFFDDTSRGWMTSIKNQGSCGSCWAFSADGSVEAKYNLEKNNSRLNPDLSEQNSVSCDHTCYSGYTYPNESCNSGCGGGWMDLALKFFKNNGTVDESCFPYNSSTGDDGDCSSPPRCSDSQNRIWKVGNYTTTWPEVGEGVHLTLTNNETKQLLIDYGPLIAAMNGDTLSGDLHSDGGIWRCNNDATTNHGVVVVGFNDTGNTSTSYWIIKNSWGIGWNGDGYFKLGFNECNFTSEFEYAVNVTPPEFKPSITLNFPSINYSSNSLNITFNFTVLNRIYQNSTCDLIINNQTVNTTVLAQNATSTILSYNLPSGQSNWSINCWENGLGIVNSSGIRGIMSGDITAPVVHLISPANNISQNNQTTTYTFNVTDDSGPANCTMYWLSGGSVNISSVPVNGITQDVPGTWTIGEGVSSWYINCTDGAGNTGMSDIWNISVDTIYPTINFTSPTETSGTTNITRNYILVNVTANDTNFKNLTMRIYNSSRTIINTTNGTLTSLFSNITGLADGIYYFNATACDILNNCNNTETRNVTIDANSPTITINSPRNNSYQKTGFIFNVSMNKNGTCWYSIDGAANFTMGSIDNRTFNATNSSMAQITHNLTFSCNDTFNHWNFTSSIFVFDTTTPVVHLISPADESTSYDTEDSIPFKYNVTDSFGIANCSLLVEGSIVSTDSNVNVNTTETINHIISSTGDADWVIRCYDKAGNYDDSDEEYRTITIKAIASNDGGGGSGTTTGTEYTVSTSALSLGYTQQLKKGDKIKFTFLNDSSGTHRMTLDSLSSDRAYVTITSDPISLTLIPGKEKKINISSSTYYQLVIKLNSIANNKANITIMEINERIDSTTVTINGYANQTGVENKTNGGNDGWTNEGISNVKKTFSYVFSNKYVLIGAGVLIMAGIVYLAWYFRRKIRRKKGWDK
jgi:C1A family cysteine protease